MLRYSAFDALQLVSYTDEYFHCEACNGELVAESDKLASDEMGDGDDNARKRRHERLKDIQQRIDDQLKPLVAQLDRVKNLPAPEFGSLQSWEKANIGAFANGDPGAPGSSGNLQGQSVSLMPDTEVAVALPDSASGKNDTGPKVMPPWMAKIGMNLTKEQKGETSRTSELDEKSEAKDDKKQESKDEKSIQDEYIKAYHEALRKMQEEEDAKRRMHQEAETFVSDSQSERLLGKKYKREDEDEGIEWEEEQPAGNTAETYSLAADVNVEA